MKIGMEKGADFEDMIATSPHACTQSVLKGTYTLSDTNLHNDNFVPDADGWAVLQYGSENSILKLNAGLFSSNTNLSANQRFGDYHYAEYPAYHGSEAVTFMPCKKGRTIAIKYQKVSGANNAWLKLYQWS